MKPIWIEIDTPEGGSGFDWVVGGVDGDGILGFLASGSCYTLDEA